MFRNLTAKIRIIRELTKLFGGKIVHVTTLLLLDDWSLRSKSLKNPSNNKNKKELLDEIDTLLRVFNGISDNPACVQAPRQPCHSYRYLLQRFYLIKAKTPALQAFKTMNPNFVTEFSNHFYQVEVLMSKLVFSVSVVFT